MDLSFTTLLLSSAFVLAIVCSAITSLLRQCHPPPSMGAAAVVKSYPIIGNLPHFVKNRDRILDWVVELVSASSTGTVTVAPVVFTTDPANVEHASRSRFDIYPKGHFSTTILHDFLGEGILNANGEPWRLQRKAASFEFNTSSLRAFLLDSALHQLDGCLIPLLARTSQAGEVIDFQDILERFAFDSICILVFGEDPGLLGGAGSDHWENFHRAFDVASQLIIHRWKYPFHWMWKLMRWLNVANERRLSDALATVRLSIDRLVQSRGTARSDGLISRFADSGYSDESSLRDALVSFLLAGRDTTPSALTWFFWILSSRPDVVDRILEELRSVRTRSEAPLTLEKLRGMHYLHAALTESMRLNPPIPLGLRECVEDDILPDGTPVRKGWTLMYSAYAMGRSERLWGADYGEFRPERWLDECGAFRPESPFKYPVFHAGPRLCLGRDMAYVQMKAVAVSILDRFQLEVAEERGEHQLLTSLRIAGGLPVRVKERKA